MITVSEIAGIESALRELPRPLALVPTMGALHQGHAALLRQARSLVGPDGTVIISIFVNPIQFNRSDDLTEYPRPLAADLALCEAEGVDLAFTPEKESLYQQGHSILVTESLLAKHLCGATRPGHFDGVLTIVLKLLNIFQPDIAIFGEKDFQQLALIRQMVRDLNVATEIVGCPTVREDDGLALSSRNSRLTRAQRADAPRVSRALKASRDLSVTGQQSPAIYLDCARTHLLNEAPSDFSIDYLELVDANTLQPIAHLSRPAVLATACCYGEVRLIDHVGIQVI